MWKARYNKYFKIDFNLRDLWPSERLFWHKEYMIKYTMYMQGIEQLRKLKAHRLSVALSRRVELLTDTEHLYETYNIWDHGIAEKSNATYPAIQHKSENENENNRYQQYKSR